MPSGPKKRRAAKKKEIEAKINTNNVDNSPNEVVSATSSSPVDGVANIVGCEFAESIENERKSLTTNEEILVAQDLYNELEFVKELIHVNDEVAQDKSGENEKCASFEEQVHVLDLPFQADSESEGTEKATGEIEEAAFGKEGVLEDDNSAKNVCKENDDAVLQDFTNELALKEADKFGTEGRNLLTVLDAAIDENLAVQSLPNEATQNYFGCPVHCNSDCTFYQLFSSQGKFESEERKFGSNIEQVERIKKMVEVELQVADKMRVILLKVLDDLTAIQQPQG